MLKLNFPEYAPHPPTCCTRAVILCFSSVITGLRVDQAGWLETRAITTAPGVWGGLKQGVAQQRLACGEV